MQAKRANFGKMPKSYCWLAVNLTKLLVAIKVTGIDTAKPEAIANHTDLASSYPKTKAAVTKIPATTTEAIVKITEATRKFIINTPIKNMPLSYIYTFYVGL